MAAPTADALTAAADGGLQLSGRADPGAEVMLGEHQVRAGTDGTWHAALTGSGQLRSISLAAERDGQRREAPGPLVLLPDGAGGALLSPGGGARLLTSSSPSTRLLALDYDAQGGLVVSGQSTPHAGILVRMDRAAVGQAEAADDGRFSIPVDHPVPPAAHVIEVSGGASQDQRRVRLSPPGHAALAAQRTDFGWRLDWTTAAGGAQATYLFDPAR